MFFYSDEFFRANFSTVTPPKELYHYTSIETLALILKYCSVRFNRADNVNDPIEAESSTLGSFKKGTFISCWTTKIEDTIPMWNLYSNNMKGVRIKLPANMFLGRDKIIYWGDGGFAVNCGQHIKMTRNEPGVNAGVSIIEGPNPIFYTDERDILYSNLHYPINGTEHKNYQTFGVALAKPKIWEYEDEWRFKILACNQQFIDLPLDFIRETYNFEKQPCIEEYIDVKLDSTVFDEMEILLGPRSTDSEITIVESLLEKYAPAARLTISSIKIAN
ncbi:DUF2971 domain-containing protein [Vibrio sp. 03-59-1]|uniref:DUF2971 domain-containing protein n=1 Tax=Vibrio sp. 03-59-1 TaxID=2607607 RepID=UPI00149354EF|nr:DUF2971 domain-containing protein [Vibrio sp. 03-59-1]NOH86061.1 DUF2971 domain-containing protein [Vibrio sp. 03-59-1]